MGQTVNKDNDLVSVTVTLLRSRPVTVQAQTIAMATGVNASFISRIQNGHFKNADARKVQKLYEYLSGRKLEL